MMAWIYLPPAAVRCQRRATTLTTRFANPVGRAVPLRVEPTYVVIDAMYVICELYCLLVPTLAPAIVVRSKGASSVTMGVRVGRAAQGAGLR